MCVVVMMVVLLLLLLLVAQVGDGRHGRSGERDGRLSLVGQLRVEPGCRGVGERGVAERVAAPDVQQPPRVSLPLDAGSHAAAFLVATSTTAVVRAQVVFSDRGGTTMAVAVVTDWRLHLS